MFKSKINTTSEDYRKNYQSLLSQVNQLQNLHQQILLGGGKDKQQKYRDQGKLTVRERIELLIDPGTEFLELSPYCAHAVYDEPVAAAGIVTGIATVSAIDCVIIANDATVKGGSYYPLTVKKHLRAQAIASANRLPCIYLVDSGGANLPYQSRLFADRDHFGRIFFNQARLSAQGIAQIACVLGPCTAGGAYIPAMADESIIVRNQGSIYLAGPPLVKAATGEEVDRESLGGADLHCKQSGLTDYACDSDSEALALTRQLVEHLNQHSDHTQIIDNNPAQFDPEELLGIIPADNRHTFNMREIIARLTDGSNFSEFKPLYGVSLICAFANIEGQPVGIVANNGILMSDSAQKACHFIQLCCQRNLPLIFLQDIVGFMVGQQAEASGIAKHGARMVSAVACAQVPKITLIVGGSYGAGNYAMCGRAYEPDFLFTWPNARVSVMGGEQAASVLSQLNKAEAADALKQQFQREGEAIFGSSHLWDDGIIDPRDSRKILARCLKICANKSQQNTHFGVWR